MLVALGVIQQNTAGQAEDRNHLQQRKAATRLLAALLGISALVFGGVSQAGAGAVDHFDPQAVPKPGGFIGLSCGGTAQPRQNIPTQARARLTPGAGSTSNPGAVLE